jgi:hypothetical protein
MGLERMFVWKVVLRERNALVLGALETNYFQAFPTPTVTGFRLRANQDKLLRTVILLLLLDPVRGILKASAQKTNDIPFISPPSFL